jgi:hypothetical protein
VLGANVNWEAIGAIAEVLGAMAVLATLLYLTIQLKQNTAQLKSTARDASLSEFAKFRMVMFENRDVADLFQNGTIDLSSLDETDLMRYRMGFVHVMAAMGGLLERVEEGTLNYDKEYLEGLVKPFVSNPGSRDMWNSVKYQFHPDYQKFVDDLIEVST